MDDDGSTPEQALGAGSPGGSVDTTLVHRTTVITTAPEPRSRVRMWLCAAVGLLVLGVAVGWAATHVGTVSATVASAPSWIAEAASALSWQAVVCLVAVSVLHYVAAAVSARAAAGVPLPCAELVAAQFAAAAANRVTPAGLGGAALLGRYLSRRGRLSGPQAVAAVSSLAVVNALASVLVFAAVVGVGALLDLAGARGEVSSLVTRVVTLVPISGTGWLWVAGVAVVTVPAGVWLVLSRPAGATARVRATVASYLGFTRTLVRQPARMAVMMLASASTSLLPAFGFAAATTLSPRGLPITAFGTLVVGYLIAAAVGGAVPAPSGLGAVDAALVGVLVTGGVSTVSAVGIALAFRLITFWSPAVVGFGLLVHLRRRGAL